MSRADLVEAITGEAGVPARNIGAIDIADRYPGHLADMIIGALGATTIKGRRVRRERPA